MSKALDVINAIKLPVGTIFKVVINGEYRENTMSIFSTKLSDGKNHKRIDWTTHPKGCELEAFDFLINAEFYEISKPVSFEKAIKAFGKGKKIRVNVSKCEEHYYANNGSDCLLNLKNGFGITWQEILYGKWFIEDEREDEQ